ncbi:leucine-rich repeat domain-containing protein [Candidatus Poribacteria bacterium]|nr:leucine-rich repeat domain-containing protein [Candidatus Poribacteria bacterium]
MRTKLYFLITLLAFFALTALPNSFAQAPLAQPSVRLVYFLPSDRPARPDRIEALRQLIKDTQEFYADEMERHGYGRKTFRVETDTDGEPMVHRVNGKFNEDYYYTGNSDFKIWEEFYEHFDDLEHIYLIAIDISYETLNDGEACGLGGIGFQPMGGEAWGAFGGNFSIRHRHETSGEEALGGSAIIPASGPCFFDDVYDHNHPLRVTTHELAHAFGLEHDVSNPDSAVGGSGFQFSERDGEWLSVSRFFSNNSVSNNSPGNIRLISTPTYNAEGISIGFEVTDADGLHQAQLLVPGIYEGTYWWGAYRLFGCKQLNGDTSDTIEFISEALIAEPADRITLQIIDVNGNITWATFLVDIASAVPPPKAISIPDPNLAAAIRSQLGLGIDDRITDQAMRRLTRLDAKENEIKDLTGLEYATQLDFLELRRNQIQDIRPIANLKNLTELIIEVNSVNDIGPLANLTQLTLLYIAANPISDFTPLANLTKLRRLALWDNNIRDVTLLADKVRLTHLYLWNNNIRDITPLSNLTQLKVLHLSRNKVSDVRPLTRLTKLETLHLYDNPIKDRDPLLAMLRRNPDLKIYLKEGGDPLPVSLSHFRAELTDVGVVLRWTTESELDNAGFNILRSETKNSEFKIVNPKLIQGAGTTSERHAYVWKDTTAKPNVVYYYRIEDISHAGVRKQLATVRMRGYVSAAGKLTTKWGDLKRQE